MRLRIWFLFTFFPFAGFHQRVIGEYYFFLPDAFQTAEQMTALGDRVTYVNEKQKVKIEVFLHARESLLERKQHHIRWVALEYKSFLTSKKQSGGAATANQRGLNWQLFASRSFDKKCDLSEDIAEYTGWELELECKTTGEYISAIFLRRQYLPPLLDNLQDIVIVLRHMRLTNEKPFGLMEPHEIRDTLSSWTHCVANTFSPIVTQLTAESLLAEEAGGDGAGVGGVGGGGGGSTTSGGIPGLFIYRDMIQAKLNALLYTEEAYHWLDTRLKLRPCLLPNFTLVGGDGARSDDDFGDGPKLTLLEEGKRFCKAILKLMNDENVLRNGEILREIGDHIPTAQDPTIVAAELFSLVRFTEVGGAGASNGNNKDARRNAWLERIAKFFVYCLNHVCGGFEKFNLHVLVDCCFPGANVSPLSPDARRKMQKVLQFLLHVRARDYSLPFSDSGALLIPLKNLDASTSMYKWSYGLGLICLDSLALFWRAGIFIVHSYSFPASDKNKDH